MHDTLAVVYKKIKFQEVLKIRLGYSFHTPIPDLFL